VVATPQHPHSSKLFPSPHSDHLLHITVKKFRTFVHSINNHQRSARELMLHGVLIRSSAPESKSLVSAKPMQCCQPEAVRILEIY